MKRGIAILFNLCFLSGCVASNPNVLPGSQRLWWYKGFDETSELVQFAKELYSAGKNDDFHLGIFDSVILTPYERTSITFSGHIKSEASKNEDAINSAYDYFEFRYSYCVADLASELNFDRPNVYFFPFYSEMAGVFNPDQIENEITNNSDGGYCIYFTYLNENIMKFEVTRELSDCLGEDEIINKVVEGYKIIV